MLVDLLSFGFACKRSRTLPHMYVHATVTVACGYQVQGVHASPCAQWHLKQRPQRPHTLEGQTAMLAALLLGFSAAKVTVRLL